MISLRSTVLAGSVVLAAIVSTGLVAQPKAKPTLDYDFYKARVEPIFLKKKWCAIPNPTISSGSSR